MHRPGTTGHLSASPASSPGTEALQATALPRQETIGSIVEALTAVVAAVESQAADGSAWKAFQSVIRRNGEEAASAGGREGMEVVLRAVADAAPDRAERRESIIAAAWAGIREWRS